MSIYDQFLKEKAGRATAVVEPPKEPLWKKAARVVLLKPWEEKFGVAKPKPEEVKPVSVYDQFLKERGREEVPKEEKPFIFKGIPIEYPGWQPTTEWEKRLKAAGFAPPKPYIPPEELEKKQKEKIKEISKQEISRLQTKVDELKAEKAKEPTLLGKTKTREFWGIPEKERAILWPIIGKPFWKRTPEEEEKLKKAEREAIEKGLAEPGVLPPFREKEKEIKNYELAIQTYNTFINQIDKDPGFFSEVARGLTETAKEPSKLIPFYGAIESLDEIVKVISGAKKLEQGKTPTSLEQSLIEKYKAQNLPIPSSIGYGVGSIIASMPTYIAEWGYLKSIVKKPVTKFVSSKVGASLAGKVVSQSIGIAAHGVSNVPEIASRTAEYLLPNYDIIQNPVAQEIYGDLGGDVSFQKALAKAIGTTAVDYITEYAGVLVEKPMSFLAKATYAKWLLKLGVKTPGDITKFVKLAKTVGWNGIIGEVFEEELAELFQAPIEEREYKNPFTTPEGVERLITETLGIGAFGGMGGISATTLNKIYEWRDKTKPKPTDISDLPKEVPPEIVPPIPPVEAPPVPPKEIPEEKGIIPPTLQPLAQEARKYKSAEEFIQKSKDIVYRGSRIEEIKGITEGLYLSPDKNYSAGFGKVSEYVIPKDKLLDTRKVTDLEFLRKNLTKQEFDYVMESGDGKLPSYAVSDFIDEVTKKGGYKGIIFHETTYRGKPLQSYYLFELTDVQRATNFYNQAVKGVEEVKPEVKPEVKLSEKLGIKTTPAGEKLLEKPTPITLEFIDWFKKTKPEWIDRAKLSTFTDGEPYFFLPGVEGAQISLKDFIKAPEVKPEVKLPREKPTLETKIGIIGEGKEAETQANILLQLETAQKGERIHWTDYDGTPHTIGVPSSFPQWIPEKLRSRKLFDAVLNHIKNDTIPIKADEVRLYNVVAEQLGLLEATKRISREEEIDVSKLFADEKTNEQISKIGRAEKEGVDREIAESISEQKAEEIKRVPEVPSPKQIDILGKERAEEEISEEAQALASEKWEMKLPKEILTKETISKTDIMIWAEKTFGFPIKTKATHKWRVAGIFYPKQQIIRMKTWGELSVATHEIAHGIDKSLMKENPIWKHIDRNIIKELADLDYDQKKRRTSEGFAEYIRYRMTTDEATKKAPMFDKYFNEILKNNPKLEANLKELRKKIDIWRNQGAENRIIKHIDWKGEHIRTGGLKERVAIAHKFIQEKFNDEFYVPQKIVREIEKIIGRKLTPTKNPAIMMEYYKAKSGAVARTFVMDAAIDEYGNVLGPSLKEIIKPIPKDELKRFIAYVVSKRAINLYSREIESGFEITDAKYIVDKYKNDIWDKAADDLTKWSNYLLDWVIRAGGIKGESVKIMRDLNPVYLPFKRAFIDEVGVVTGVGGYVDKGGIIKGIKGSGRPIINPLEAMVTQARELIGKSQRIHIARLFAELSAEEGVGGFIVEVPAPMTATKFQVEQIKKYLDNIGIDTADINLDDFLTVFTQDWSFKGKENIVSVFKNGERKFFEIHPELYETFKGIDPLKLGPIGKIFAPFARLLRLGATGLKFSFGLARNPFRDAFSYVVFSKRNKVTIFDPAMGIYKDLTTKPGEVTWRFKKLGGQLSGMMGFDRAAVQSTYDDMLMENLGKKGKVLKVVKHPVNTLREILSVTEMGPRSVEVEQSYKMYMKDKEKLGWTEEDAFVQAFIDAQDVTVNFTKSGKWAKQINNVTAFFNVAIRGPEKVYRSFKERPIETIVKGLLWLTLIAIGSWYKNKDKDWYKNLPPAYKYNNLFFEFPDNNIVRLPIPFELGILFMSIPQAVLDTYKDQDIKWLKGLYDLAKSQVPDPTPSAFQPLIDIKTNKNWMGIPIESEGMQYLYPTERKRDYTSGFASVLSNALDSIGLQVSPIQIDYLLDSYSGGFMRQFRISGEELADLPVLSDLMVRSPEYPKRQLNEFFSEYETLQQKKKSEIASIEEQAKLIKLNLIYDGYKVITRLMKNAEEKKDKDKVVEYQKKLTDFLKKYGYD